MTDTGHTTKILPVNPVIADLWRAKAEAPPGPGAKDLLNRIAADCVEITTEYIDGNTLVQKICIKEA